MIKYLLTILFVLCLAIGVSSSYGPSDFVISPIQEIEEKQTCKIIEGKRYFLREGKYFVLYTIIGPKLVVSVDDIQLTILKIHEDPETGLVIAEFNVSYDQPDIFCQTHGKDSYDMYKHNLHPDPEIGMKGFVSIDYLECEEE